MVELQTVTRPIPHIENGLGPQVWCFPKSYIYTHSEKLDKIFRLGEQSGQKTDPTSIAQAMANFQRCSLCSKHFPTK